MVLFVHSGPWWRDRWWFNPWHQWLANQAYVVLRVNFHDFSGSGDVVNSGNREWVGEMHGDLIDAGSWS
jgi:dipeptidyl aminopeptidase/acylaminoacyl peptidase